MAAISMVNYSSQELALGLIREYLSRKQATATLAALSNELPSPGPMSRVGLIERFGLAKVVRSYKDSGSSLNTLLEVLADWLASKSASPRNTSAHNPQPTNTSNSLMLVSTSNEVPVPVTAPKLDLVAVPQPAKTTEQSSNSLDLDLDEVEALVNKKVPSKITSNTSSVASVQNDNPKSHQVITNPASHDQPAKSQLNRESAAARAAKAARERSMRPMFSSSSTSASSGDALDSLSHLTLKSSSNNRPTPAILNSSPDSISSSSNSSRIPSDSIMTKSSAPSDGRVHLPLPAASGVGITPAVLAERNRQSTQIRPSNTQSSSKNNNINHWLAEDVDSPPFSRPTTANLIGSRRGQELVIEADDDDDDNSVIKSASIAESFASNSMVGEKTLSSAHSKASSSSKSSIVSATRIAAFSNDEVSLVDKNSSNLQTISHASALRSAPSITSNATAVASGLSSSSSSLPRRSLTSSESSSIRRLLFGGGGFGGATRFSPSWLQQGLCFDTDTGLDRPDALRFGLIQFKSGPCGVLAAIQSYMLRYLLFTGTHVALSRSKSELLSASDELRQKALLMAMATMLLQASCAPNCASSGQQVFIVIPRNIASEKLDLDQLDVIAVPSSSVASPLRLCSPHSSASDFSLEERMLQPVFSALSQFANAFQKPNGGGVVLFLYSMMMTRGVAVVDQERDHESLSLIASYGYCAQESVNLMLIGRAHSNVFDGDQQMGGQGSANEPGMLLRGVSEQSQVGFLALTEARGDVRVGQHYKEPHWPIWVVFAESHYSVLFSTELNVAAASGVPRSQFDLIYYDELANQDEEIRLTVDPQISTKDKDTDMISYLDICIRTRWPKASVSWNGSTPLL